MFPCKVKIEALDKANTKVPEVDFKGNRSVVKGQLKKLMNNQPERTQFYYIGEYFQKNGKAVGDFLALGKSMKLEKQFIQAEMKKSNKSVVGQDQDPKKAATGDIYVDMIDEVLTICFEPHDKCKIPTGRWPKLLKRMKEYFSGKKAVAIINGEIIQDGELDRGDEVESTTEDQQEAPTTTLDLNTVKKQVQQLLGQFKALAPNKVYQKLGVIHKINDLLKQLEEVPSNLQNLADKLGQQQTKIAPVFSKQIDQRFTQSMEQLQELPSIDSCETLDQIFGTIQKMYEGWKTFLPEQEHPQGKVIERVNDEIDILKEYEEQIVPLRQEYDSMEDSDEKEQLGEQINTLIRAAKEALA